MKLLIDENMHSYIVRWPRGLGHDVIWATESLCGQPDTELLGIAVEQERIILTSDLDFGDLIYHQHQKARGVVLMRMDDLPIHQRLARLQTAWAIVESNPQGKYIVITDSKIRVRNLPRYEAK